MRLGLDTQIEEVRHAIREGFPISVGSTISAEKSLPFGGLDVVAGPIERGESVSHHVLGPDPVPTVRGFDWRGKGMFLVTHKT